MAEDTAPEPFRPSYTPAPGEAQLTARAVIAGCLIGGVCGCTNIYMGLKVGWTFGASIIAAVLSFAVFAALGKRLSVLETNIAQAAGSSAGYMSSSAGLVSAIPAMTMLGERIEWWALMLWAVATAFLGVFFAVPLRRQMLEVDNLPFPSGIATCETILAMVSDASDSLGKSRMLLYSAIYAGLFALTGHFVPAVESPPLHEWIVWAPLAAAAAWGFTVSLGPALMGAGFIMGPRVIFSLVAGAIVSWGILGPLVKHFGLAPGANMAWADGARGWLLWPGVSLMVAEALASLAMSWRTFVRAFQFNSAKEDSKPEFLVNTADRIPASWWMGGLAAGSIVTVLISEIVFGIMWPLTLIAIALSAVLAIVAVRSVGETDINPIGGMGKVTQLVFGGLASGSITTNLMCAAITGAGASQAGDMMTDLKTARMLGASPRKLLVAQLWGCVAGIIFVVPVYYVFTSAYELGGEKLPAPAAFAWKAMAELLNKGFSSLPPYAPLAIFVATLVGAALPVLRQFKVIQPYVPSGLAFGIAFIVPAYNSFQMFWGLLILWIWQRFNKQAADKYAFTVASGLIAGEGLMGIVNAGLTILGIG